jgi:GNAT superfamily N-acetyltransferase
VEVVVRPAIDHADEVQSLSIHNQVWPRAAVSMDEVESFKRSTLAYGDHLALLDEQAIGSASVAIMPARPDVGFALITVVPQHRRRGAGSSLYRAVSTWCASQAIEAIEARVMEGDDVGVAFALHRGFVEIERNGGMELDLTGYEVSAAPPPAGVEIVTWAERPDTAPGIYEVATEAYRDIPGSEHEAMEPYDDWLLHDLQGSGDRPEATFVALAGAEVVGYAKFSLTQAQPTIAFHDMTGVKRAWRGRGIAGALKRAQIRWAKAQGYERLVTANEMRNEPIRRLNASLGYQEAPGRIILRGPILRD